MRSYIPHIAVILLVFTTACTSSGKVSDNGDSDEKVGSSVKVDNPSVSMADYLKRVPGVSVFGNGSDAQVLIRGAISQHGNTSPLFVVDGIRYGRNFSRVQSSVPVDEIESIKVLKGVEASSAYGLEGSAGVVEIKTKQRN